MVGFMVKISGWKCIANTRRLMNCKIYIFGAHSHARTLAVYLQSLYPGVAVEAYLYDNDEPNPYSINGVSGPWTRRPAPGCTGLSGISRYKRNLPCTSVRKIPQTGLRTDIPGDSGNGLKVPQRISGEALQECRAGQPASAGVHACTMGERDSGRDPACREENL